MSSNLSSQANKPHQKQSDAINLFEGMTDAEIEQFLLDSSLDNSHEETEIHSAQTNSPLEEALLSDDIIDAPASQQSHQLEEHPIANTSIQGMGSLPITQPLSSESHLNDNTNRKTQAKEQMSQTDKTVTQYSLSEQFKTPNPEQSSKNEDLMQAVANEFANFQHAMRAIADASDAFYDSSSSLISKIRELESQSDDDFSITYEQVYQLRGCMMAAKRAFNEIPNFFDVAEQAWENDLYTAQMRQKKTSS